MDNGPGVNNLESTDMKIETGVMVMKDGKAWGITYHQSRL